MSTIEKKIGFGSALRVGDGINLDLGVHKYQEVENSSCREIPNKVVLIVSGPARM
jgi:hypothetical protein